VLGGDDVNRAEGAVTQVASSARRASNSTTMAGLARFGLAARAFVYLVVGWLAIQIARGHGGHQANQRGALGDIAQHSYGIVLRCGSWLSVSPPTPSGV
jgi:Domain of Unknown Function (DUF1206)